MQEIDSFLGSISNKGNLNDDEKFVTLSFLLCKTFGWDYHTLIKQPIPFVYSLLGQIIKDNKRQEEEMKKSTKKRR